MFIYLDESGNLTKSNGKYFIVTSYTIGDPRRIAKAFRKWQKNKFPRKLKYQSEVKFNDSHLTDDLREKTLKFLAKQDVRIFYTYLKIFFILILSETRLNCIYRLLKLNSGYLEIGEF